jgi:hypothetical protein
MGMQGQDGKPVTQQGAPAVDQLSDKMYTTYLALNACSCTFCQSFPTHLVALRATASHAAGFDHHSLPDK